ncbi:MAG TPA: trehalase family glycosidase [Armatimonadota bacterium]|jgi:hypothetical protein
MSTTHGWTTWDPSSIAVWEHLPSGLRCALIVQNEAGQTLSPTNWETLEEILPDDAGRSLAHLRLLVGDAEVEVECGAAGDVGACRIAQVLGDSITAHWEVNGALDGWQVRRGTDEIIFAPDAAALPNDVAGFLREQWDVARLTVPQGGWLLEQPLEAMEATIAANTFVLPSTGQVLTLSRHTLEASDTWSVPNWETFLTALGIAYTDPALAIANVRAALRLLAVDGIFSAEATPNGPQRGLSNPPVASYVVWKIFQLTGDEALLREAYPLLLRWHDWWWNNRDGNQNHLLNWASAAETGMPGHPLYESAPTDPQTGIMRIDDVGLCSLWSLDAFALMRMALHVNDLDQATHLENEINDVASRVNLMLWDPMQGIFRSRDWAGFPTDRESATVFLSLVGGIPTRAHAERMLDSHLTVEFRTPFLVPTLGTDDAEFEEQLPWRGRVSPLLNMLICEGLRQFGQDELAETISLSGLDLISRSWQKDHQVFASYNALTGEGDDIAQDPLAPTGVLFGALGIALLIDVEPWNGMRLGNTRGLDLSVHGLPFQGDLLDVASGPWGLTASRNGQPWLEMDRPAILRNLVRHESEISCSVKLPGGGPIRLRFHGFAPEETVALKVNGIATTARANDAGVAECQVTLEPPHGGFGIWHRAA